MKTLSTVIASIILASGSAVAMAATDQQGAATDRPGATTQQPREDRTGVGQGGATEHRPGTGMGQQQDDMDQRTGVGQREGMEGMEHLPAFSTIDRAGTGNITRQEARSAGIDEDKFDKMDQDGDGVVSQEEYQEFRDEKREDKDY